MKDLGLIKYTWLTCQQRGGAVGEWVHIDFADIDQSETLKPIETEKIEIRLPEKNPDDWVTPNFSKRELTRSDTAIRLKIDNTPNAQEWAYIKYSAEWLEKIRAYAGRPIIVSSCFRCAAVNRRVGGSSTSAHCFGLAVDFDIVATRPRKPRTCSKKCGRKVCWIMTRIFWNFPNWAMARGCISALSPMAKAIAAKN